MGSYFTVDYYHSLSDFSLLSSFRLINPNVDIGVWYFLVSAFLWHWLCMTIASLWLLQAWGAWLGFCSVLVNLFLGVAMGWLLFEKHLSKERVK